MPYTKSWCALPTLESWYHSILESQTWYSFMGFEDVWVIEFRVCSLEEVAFLASKVSLLALAVWAQAISWIQKSLVCSFLINLLQFLLLFFILSLLHLRVRYRCCSVRHGVCEVARGAPPDHVRAPSGSARTLARKWAATVRRQLFGALWRVDAREEHDREIRRLPHRLRHVEDTSWEMLHVDWRFSPIGSYQGAKPISLKLLIYLHLGQNHLLHHLLLFLLLLLLQFLANILF